MSGPAVDMAPRPRRVSPTNIDIDGTIDDGELQLTMPTPAASLREELGAELASDRQAIALGVEQLVQNRNLLTAAQYQHWAGYLQTADNEIETALRAGDAEKVRALVAELRDGLEKLGDYFNYESGQGLISIHAETGVRIYLSEGQVYFVSPDAQAFNHSENAESISGYVQVDQSYGAIDQTEYQDQGRQILQIGDRSRELDMLGCRIDQLALYERPDGTYVITTKLRPDGEQFQDFQIRFTLAQAMSEGVGDNPNDPSVVRDLQAFGALPGRDGLAEEIPPVPPAGAADIAADGRFAVAAEQSPTRVLTRELQQDAPEARPGADPGRYARQLQLTTDISSHRTRIRGINPAALTDPSQIADALKDMDDQRQSFRELIDERERFLRSELDSGSADPSYRDTLQRQLAQVEKLRTEETMCTKALLEKQLAGGDDVVSKSAKVRLVAMADDIERGYTAQMGAAADDAARQAIDVERQQFAQNVEAWRGEMRSWGRAALDRIGNYLENNSWLKWVRDRGSASIDFHPLRDYFDRRTAARATTALAEHGALCARDFTAMDANARTGYLGELEAQEKTFAARIRTLERQIAAGTSGLDAELAQLQDARAKVVLREAECLTARIDELGADARAAQPLQSRLYGELAESVEDAYRHVARGRELTDAEKLARDNFRAKGEEYRFQQGLESTRTRLPFLDERDIAARQLRGAEQRVGETADGSPARAEAEASRELAQTRKSITDTEAEISHCKDRLNLSPDDEAMKQRLAAAEDQLRQLRQREFGNVETLKQAQVSTAEARITAIDNELGGTVDEATRRRLLTERSRLRTNILELQTEVETLRAGAAVQTANGQAAEIARQLEAKRTELAACRDPAEQVQLKTRVAELQTQLAASNIAAIDGELGGITQSRGILSAELTAVETDLAALADRTSREGVLLEARKKMIKTRLDGLDKTEAFLGEKKQMLVLEQTASAAEARVPAAQVELEQLRAREASTLSPADQQRITDLEQEVSHAQTCRAQAVAARGGFVQRWQRTFRDMRVNGARMIQQLRTMDWNPAHSNSAWHSQVEGPGRWMEKNPMKSAMVAAGITEALHMTTINWDADAVHTPVPAVMFLLEKPLETWGLDLDLAQFEFTTEQGGAARTLAAEAFNRTGNVATGLGALYLVQRGAQRSPFLARGLGMAGAPLAHVGSAYFGYAEFSHFEHWQNDSNLALTGRVSSPIVGGALAGSFFGPPGAAIGATAGAIGEVAGVTHALVRLDYEQDQQWRERGVRDSIAMGIQGYLLPEDDPRVRSRGALSEEEKGVIDNFARELTLRRIFGMTGQQAEDGSMVEAFSDDELRRAGFRVVGAGATQAQREEAGRHNYEHLTRLFDNVEDNYNPFTSFTYLDALKRDHPELGARFEEIRNSSINHYTDLYARSMQVEYSNLRESSAVWEATTEIWHNHWASPGRWLGSGRDNQSGGRVDVGSEQMEYLRGIAGEFRRQFDDRDAAATTPEERGRLAQEQWDFFYDVNADSDSRRLPGLEQILRDRQSRQVFINLLGQEGADGSQSKPLSEYAMWTDMGRCDTGGYMLTYVMPDKFLDDQAAIAEEIILAEGN